LKIFHNLSTYNSDKKTFVTIGTFDGVHIGHNKVIKNLVTEAKEHKAISVLLTFFPHPRMVLQKNADIKLINTINERIKLLDNTGLDVLIIQEFTQEFSKQSSFNFVESILVKKLNVSKLFIGYDHQFGQNRDGNFNKIKEYGEQFNFKVQEITKLDINDIAVSSTMIRKAIENGDILNANTNLGYNFMLSGSVVEGKNLGEKIGFPTANLDIKESYKLLPKTGAYVVKSNIDNQQVFGMMNIGFRPTVSGENQTIEVHFFNFKKDIYDKEIHIEILQYLRDEKKFDSIESLIEQLQKDKQKALKIINGIFFDL